MRTAEEIVEYIKADDGFLSFQSEVLVPYLPFDEAKQFLKDGVTVEGWVELPQPISPERVLADVQEYMKFAWDKALDHRGLSASRSVSKMTAWMWMLGDDELVELCSDDSAYPQYGAPILRAISEKYGCEIPQSDFLARMAQGLPCESGCDMGCGR